jgi:hypothetical protein
MSEVEMLCRFIVPSQIAKSILFFYGLKNDIKFDPLKGEPRFQALMDKI